jgi:hypothetical protein
MLNAREALTREDDRNTEDKEDACNRQGILWIIRIDLTVDNGLADQRNSDTRCSPKQRFASSKAINEEYDEDEI